MMKGSHSESPGLTTVYGPHHFCRTLYSVRRREVMMISLVLLPFKGLITFAEHCVVYDERSYSGSSLQVGEPT